MFATIKHIWHTQAGHFTTDWIVLAVSVILLTFTVTTTASGGALFSAIFPTASIAATN
ncbi:MAG: hypothetical protein ACU0DI_05895 [Paracoccaceae bacterium]